MPLTALTETDLLDVLLRAGHALTLTQIIDRFDNSPGAKGAISRDTVAVRLKRLIEDGRVVKLAYRQAKDYGAEVPDNLPTTNIYITTQDRRSWDTFRLGQEIPVQVSGDRALGPARGNPVLVTVKQACEAARQEVSLLADQLRERTATLEGQVARQGVLHPVDAAAIRDRLGWLRMIAADLQSAAGPSEAVPPDTDGELPDRRRDDAEIGDTQSALQRFRDAIWATFTAHPPRNGASDFRTFILGPGFLRSFRDQNQRVRSSVLKLVVRVLTDAPAPQEQRRPRSLHAFLYADGTRVQAPGLWSVRTNPSNAHGRSLVWREGPDEAIELLAVVPEDRLLRQ